MEKIELSPEVFDEAKYSSIDDYLEDNTIIIKGDMSNSAWNGVRGTERIFGSSSDLHINAYREAEATRYRLGRSELQSIIKWLGGDINQ